MNEALVLALQNGGAGGMVAGALWLAGKAIDRWKPRHERETEAMRVRREMQKEHEAALRDQARYWQEQFNNIKRDVEELRTAQQRASIERHHFVSAITSCIQCFPDTGRWWAEKIAEIEKRVESNA